MEERKPVSVFKSICWCILLTILTFIADYLLIYLYAIIIGLLMGYVGFINSILSIKWIYFVFMGFTTADIGRRVGALMMAIFAKPMEKSRNIGKGFIGTGVIMIFIFVFYIGLLIYKHSWSYIDFSTLLCGIWFIIYGRISEDEDL